MQLNPIEKMGIIDLTIAQAQKSKGGAFMVDRFARSRLLLGEENMARLAKAKVAVFGIGGVGGYVAEALARTGVGSFLLVDDDKVCLTNINRQIIATEETLGRYKVDVMRERIRKISPDAQVDVRKCFFLPENAHTFDLRGYSYVVDAVDTVTAKLEIVTLAKKWNIPVISCMGAGNKLDPTKFQVADIYQTSICPLARVMRRECKKRGIADLKVVYSTEPPVKLPEGATEDLEEAGGSACPPDTGHKRTKRRDAPGSVAFVPSVAGLIAAGEIIRDLTVRP